MFAFTVLLVLPVQQLRPGLVVICVSAFPKTKLTASIKRADMRLDDILSFKPSVIFTTKNGTSITFTHDKTKKLTH